MAEIPMPQILQSGQPGGPDYPADEDVAPDRLIGAVRHARGYGRQLWTTLDAVRTYLLDSLPPDPNQPNQPGQPGAARRGASPSGPDDSVGWDRWIEAYAEVTSALAGPHGDSGYGISEARQAAQDRRQAPSSPSTAPGQAAEHAESGDHTENAATPLPSHVAAPAGASSGSGRFWAGFGLGVLGAAAVLGAARRPDRARGSAAAGRRGGAR